MFLHTKLENRKVPMRIALIGCGKFVLLNQFLFFFTYNIAQL